jgi:hypothetical protein
MLVPRDVCVKPPHPIRGADPADKPFVFQKLQYPVNGRVRQGRHFAAEPGMNPVGRRVTRIRSQSPIDSQTLGGDSNAALAASFLKALAPVRDFLGRPRRRLPQESKASGSFRTSSYHMGNIII